MAYFQQKNNKLSIPTDPDHTAISSKVSIFHPTNSYLRNFKKSNHQKSRITQCLPPEEYDTKKQKYYTKEDSYRTNQENLNQVKSTKIKSQNLSKVMMKGENNSKSLINNNQAKTGALEQSNCNSINSFMNNNRNNSKKQNNPVKQSIQARPPKNNYQNQSNFNEEESMNRSLRNLILETDNSMQELLNSSINQFERQLEESQQSYEDNLQTDQIDLMEQNQYLKSTLSKLKNIIKSKLETALKKQKDELTKMLADYLELITKLLKDKEQLTNTIQTVELDLSKSHQQIKQQKEQFQQSVRLLNQEKDQHVSRFRGEIEELMRALEEYEEEANMENSEFEQMKNKVVELEEKLIAQQTEVSRTSLINQKLSKSQNDEDNLNKKLHSQHNKIQALLELLERSQEENKSLKHLLNEREKIFGSDVKIYYQQQLRNMQKEHEEQFMQYERAIRETISKKDQCIERLSSIIDSFRNAPGKKNIKDTSLDASLVDVQK